MASITAGNHTSTILPLGAVLTVAAGTGRGSIVRRAYPQGSGQPFPPVQWTGAELTFGPFDEISSWRFICDNGQMNITQTRPIASGGNQYASRFRKTLTQYRTTTIAVPPGSTFTITGDGRAIIIPRMVGINAEPGTPVYYNGTPITYDASTALRVFGVACLAGEVTLETAWYNGAPAPTPTPTPGPTPTPTPVPTPTPLPAFASYAARRLDVDGSAPIIDLDYENGRFYVGNVIYTSLDAAVNAGAVIKSANSPIGDDWALPAYGGSVTIRGKGVASAAAPTSGASQFMACLDDGTTNNTNIVTLSRNYRAANDYPASSAVLRSGTTGNVSVIATPSVANGDEFLATAAAGVGTAGARLAVPRAASATTNINGVPETLSRLIVGNNRAGTRSWGGAIHRVTVFAGVLAIEKLQATAAAAMDGGRLPLWAAGYIKPEAVCIGDVTYVAGYMPGNPFAMAISNKNDSSYGSVLAYRSLGTTPNGIDDHNRPSIRLNKAGTGFSFVYNDHTSDNLFRYRNTTTPDLKNYAASGGSVDTSSLGGGNSYAQQFVHQPTGDIYAICRQGLTKYTYMRSTDNGATFTLANARVAFTHTDQFYYQARWIDDDTLLMYFSENPTAAQGQIRVLTWNVVTGEVRSGSGVLGNVLSGAANAGVSIGGATLLRSEATADWSAGVFFPSQFGVSMIWGRSTNPSGTALFGESYYARHTGGSYFDVANYQITKIADVGLGGGYQQRFTGGNAPSQLSTLTRPRVFIGQHVGNTWQITQWDASDANGTSWSKTDTLRTVSDANYNVAFRPISPENCSERLECLWTEGYYEDYFGAGKLNLFQCWKRDGAVSVPPGDIVAPTITSSSTGTVAENQAYSRTLTANEPVAWSLRSGDETSQFTLDGATLSLPAKDFETPQDGDANNTYIARLRATDAAGNVTDFTHTVTITDVAEGSAAPQLASANSSSGPSEPEIIGTPETGQRWQFSLGRWNPDYPVDSFEMRLETVEATPVVIVPWGAPIDSGTFADQGGKTLRLRVRAINAAGTTEAQSAVFGPIVVLKHVLSVVFAPSGVNGETVSQSVSPLPITRVAGANGGVNLYDDNNRNANPNVDMAGLKHGFIGSNPGALTFSTSSVTPAHPSVAMRATSFPTDAAIVSYRADVPVGGSNKYALSTAHGRGGAPVIGGFRVYDGVPGAGGVLVATVPSGSTGAAERMRDATGTVYDTSTDYAAVSDPGGQAIEVTIASGILVVSPLGTGNVAFPNGITVQKKM